MRALGAVCLLVQIVFRFHQDKNIEENVELEEASANVLDFQHILQGDAG